jgi:VanZ family protein
VRRLLLSTSWAIVVLYLGSAYFGAEQTRDLVSPILKWLAPTAPPAALQAAHMLLRKLCHVIEYGILALLWFRALIARPDRSPRAAAWLALGICLTCAFVDEAHQSMLLARTGSARDLVLDAAGALAVLIVSRTRREGGDRGPWVDVAPQSAE